MNPSYDLVFKDVRVVDGSGDPAYTSDIGISEGKITALAPELETTAVHRVIDARGMAASPGFIDTHTHDDAYLLRDPLAELKTAQGVTTGVIGNCGVSLAPSPPDVNEFYKSVGGLLGCSGAGERTDGYETFGAYLERLDETPVAMNVVPLVGHTTIRLAVMGWDARAAQEDELEQMQALTAEAMAAGAHGLSTGLIYLPAISADTEEIIRLAQVVGRCNGIYATHMRDEGDTILDSIREVLQIARTAGVRAQISHHKNAWRQNWGRSGEILQVLDEARAQGLAITSDQYPYTAASTYLATVLPPDFAAGNPAGWMARLKEPDDRQRLIRQIEESDSGWENAIKDAGFDNILVSFSDKYQTYAGRSIGEISVSEKRNPYDVTFDLLADEGMNIGMVVFLADEADLQNIMQHPQTMIGSDGLPGSGTNLIHPRMTGTFPRVLGRYVREQGLLTLEEAIRKMTSLPARTFGLDRKGLLKKGYDADLVIFDPTTVGDRGTYSDPFQKPAGIGWVVVDGQIVIQNGESTGLTPGRVLRRGA